MEPRDFAYWLQGFFEVSNAKTLNEEQVAMIRSHLETVFRKVTMKQGESLSDWAVKLEDALKDPGLICSSSTTRYC
jgi:hypothetical protein